MGRTDVHFILFLTFVSLPGVRSENVTCRWDGSFEAEGECFLYNSTQLSYSDAKSSCQSKGGVLAKLKSRTQFFAVSKYTNYIDAWIGANDSVKEGTWVWEDDGAVATELPGLWYPSEPSNKTLSEDCALIVSAQVFDEECDRHNRFICEEKAMITTPDLAASASTTKDPITTPDLAASASTTKDPITTPDLAASATVDPICTSTSSVTVPVTTMMKCDAIFINVNVQMLLLLNLYAFSYLVI